MSVREIAAMLLLLVAPAAHVVVAQDTVRVRADGPGRWGAAARLVHELSVGTAEGPPEYAFGTIGAATADRSGNIYVYDDANTQIRRYDARGRHLGTIGRAGSGPGEYRSGFQMEIIGDSLLVVFDAPNGRFTHFGLDGVFRRVVPSARPAWTSDVVLADTDGRLYIKTPLPTPGGYAEGPGSQQQYVRLRIDGAAIDSIVLPTEPAVPQTFFLSMSDGLRWAFTERQLVAPCICGGVLWAMANRYRFVVTRPGRPALLVERAHRPVQLLPDERADWLAWAAHFRAQGGGPYEIPRVKPAIRSLQSDDSGRIWVEVWVEAEKRNDPPRPAGDPRPLLTWKERTTFDVFSADGAYLGRVQLPPEASLLRIRGERLYLRTRGPDGEHRLSVYRLVTPAG